MATTTRPDHTARLHDGVYFAHPDGCAWEAYIVRGGRTRGCYAEADAATRTAAGQECYTPTDDDQILDAGECAAVQTALGEDAERHIQWTWRVI